MDIKKIQSTFVAQYLWQEVFMYDDWITPDTLTPFRLHGAKGSFLLLKTIDQLSDEELKTFIYDIFRDSNCTADFEDLIKWHKQEKAIDVLKQRVRSVFDLLIKIYGFKFYQSQWLFRIGILIPFSYIDDTGLVITLSEEEIINLGWAKIKE